MVAATQAKVRSITFWYRYFVVLLRMVAENVTDRQTEAQANQVL